jgi:hypothetical protein
MQVITWLRGIPVWYWGWSFSTICIGLALMLYYPYNRYFLIASVLCSLALVSNYVIYTLITHAKNSRFFQNKK